MWNHFGKFLEISKNLWQSLQIVQLILENLRNLGDLRKLWEFSSFFSGMFWTKLRFHAIFSLCWCFLNVLSLILVNFMYLDVSSKIFKIDKSWQRFLEIFGNLANLQTLQRFAKAVQRGHLLFSSLHFHWVSVASKWAKPANKIMRCHKCCDRYLKP